MKANATASSTASTAGKISTAGHSNASRQSHAPSFAKVFDGRKQPIRGLWVRNGRYYAQLKIENAKTGVKKTKRVPLVDKDSNPVATAAQAVAELKRLQTQRADNTLPVLARTPKFSDYAKTYTDFLENGQGAKKPGTVEKEKAILARWTDKLGGLRLDQIKRSRHRFMDCSAGRNEAGAFRWIDSTPSN